MLNDIFLISCCLANKLSLLITGLLNQLTYVHLSIKIFQWFKVIKFCERLLDEDIAVKLNILL